MAENTNPSSPLYFELKFQGCPHTSQIPLSHGADCKFHCFVCMPELRERPFPGVCPR
jgi:hypothetical protein